VDGNWMVFAAEFDCSGGKMNETIQSLIDLTGISDQDCVILKNSADQTQEWADEFVKMFYDTLFDYPRTRALFKEGERSHREKTIRNWYLQVIKGELDDEFWRGHLQVGRRHIEREILNAYMLGMMHQTQQFFLGKCLATFEQDAGLAVFNAFKRVTDITAGIIAEGYHTPYAVMRVGR
jgi:hypothetical protein